MTPKTRPKTRSTRSTRSKSTPPRDRAPVVHVVRGVDFALRGTRETLLRAFRRGLPVSLAAALAGISSSTLIEYLATGAADLDAGRPTHAADLVAAVRSAEASHALEALKRINDAGNVDWRAAAWILERRHGFGASTRVDVTARPGRPDDVPARIDVDLSALSVAGLRALAYGEVDTDEDPAAIADNATSLEK